MMGVIKNPEMRKIARVCLTCGKEGVGWSWNASHKKNFPDHKVIWKKSDKK